MYILIALVLLAISSNLFNSKINRNYPMNGPSHTNSQSDHSILDSIDLVKQSWRFVPKHLLAIKSQQKVQGGFHKKNRDRDATYQQSTIQIIKKNKNLYLAPILDIQEIMKHFQRKFQGVVKMNEKVNSNYYHKSKKSKTKKCPRKQSTYLMNRGQHGEQLIQNRISKLLQLPTIKRANSQAQKLRSLSVQQSTIKCEERSRILSRFEQYFSKQIDLIKQSKPNTSNHQNKQLKFRSRRIKTSTQC